MRILRNSGKVSIGVGLLLASSALATVTPSELRGKWVLPKERVLNEKKWGRMIELMNEDDETRGLLEGVTSRLRIPGPEHLIPMISLCPKGSGGGIDEYRIWIRDVSAPIYLVPDHEKWMNEILAGSSGVMDYRLLATESRYELRLAHSPEMCIRSGDSMLFSYLGVVHEFTHLSRYQPLKDFNALEFQGADDYARKRLSSEGGEIEAYSAEIRALKRLKSEGRARWYFSPMERFFDSRGNLTNREGLARHLLDKVGYGRDFRRDFLRKVSEQHEESSRRLERMLKLDGPNAREKLLAAEKGLLGYQESLASLEKALKIGPPPHDSATKIAEAQGQVEASDQERALLKAYLEGMEAEAARLQAEVKEIERRFPFVLDGR